MMRLLLFVLVAVLFPLQAWAACDAYSTDVFVGEVPYFYNRMNPAEGQGGDYLVHADDPNIVVAFSLHETDELGVVSRSEFLRELETHLDGVVDEVAAQGMDGEYAIFPYDPVTWTVVAREESRVATGTTTMRIDPGCSFVAEWRVLETTALAGRVTEFMAALDALRAFAEIHMGPAGFDRERTTPQGMNAVLVGAISPVLAAGVLFYVLNTMVMLGRPGMSSRLCALVVGCGCAASLLLQIPVFAAGFAEGYFYDVVALMVLVMASAFAGAFIGEQHSILWGLSISIIAGFTLAISTVLEWAADPFITGATAVLLVLSGVLGLVLWQNDTSAKMRSKVVHSS